MKALCLTVLWVRWSRFWWRLWVWFLNSTATRLYLLCRTGELERLRQWTLSTPLRLPCYIYCLILAANEVLELQFIKTSRFAAFNTPFLMLLPCSFLFFYLILLNLKWLLVIRFQFLLIIFLHRGLILICELNHLWLAPLIIFLLQVLKFLSVKRYYALLILYQLSVLIRRVARNYSQLTTVWESLINFRAHERYSLLWYLWFDSNFMTNERIRVVLVLRICSLFQRVSVCLHC